MDRARTAHSLSDVRRAWVIGLACTDRMRHSSVSLPPAVQAVVASGCQTAWMTNGDDPWDVFVCHVPADTQSAVYAGLASSACPSSRRPLDDPQRPGWRLLHHVVARRLPAAVQRRGRRVASLPPTNRRRASTRRLAAAKPDVARRPRRRRRRAQRRPARRVRQPWECVRRSAVPGGRRRGDRRMSVPPTSVRSGAINRRWT